MKKAKVGKKILDVLTPQEYAQRVGNSKERMELMAEDTAIVQNGYIYPLNRQYSKNVPGATDYGPMIRVSHPDSMDRDSEYDAKNIIDFDNVTNLKEAIEKQAELERAEKTILISPDNIFKAIVQEKDTPEMKLLKEAINRKHIDLDTYKQRFGSDFNNDKRLFDQPSITFFKLKRIADVMDIRIDLTLSDKPGAVNPIGEKLSAQITTTESDDEGEK